MPRRCGGQSVSCRWAGDMFAEARVPTCARRRWRAGPTDKCACVRRMRAAAVRRHAACQLSSPTRDRETITGRPSVKLKCSQGRYRRQQTAAAAAAAADDAVAGVSRWVTHVVLTLISRQALAGRPAGPVGVDFPPKCRLLDDMSPAAFTPSVSGCILAGTDDVDLRWVRHCVVLRDAVKWDLPHPR